MFFFPNINEVFRGEQEKEFIIRVRMGIENLSLAITIYHHSTSLVMSIGDPLDGFFYPTLTLMMGFYILSHIEMIAKLEGTVSTAKQNKDLTSSNHGNKTNNE